MIRQRNANLAQDIQPRREAMRNKKRRGGDRALRAPILASPRSLLDRSVGDHGVNGQNDAPLWKGRLFLIIVPAPAALGANTRDLAQRQ
jgi:hypothetical protein